MCVLLNNNIVQIIYFSLAICLAADSYETQFTWIRSLGSCGVDILPSIDEEDDLVRNATSIFDFEALDIEGKTIALDKYRYDM